MLCQTHGRLINRLTRSGIIQDRAAHGPVALYRHTGKHCVFYHRYHLVWPTKYRYKVLQRNIRLRVRDIIRQVCAENDVDIIRGILSSDHVHMFVSVPPKLAISDLMREMKGRPSQKVQREFPQLKKRYWGRHFSLSCM